MKQYLFTFIYKLTAIILNLFPTIKGVSMKYNLLTFMVIGTLILTGCGSKGGPDLSRSIP